MLQPANWWRDILWVRSASVTLCCVRNNTKWLTDFWTKHNSFQRFCHHTERESGVSLCGDCTQKTILQNKFASCRTQITYWNIDLDLTSKNSFIIGWSILCQFKFDYHRCRVNKMESNVSPRWPWSVQRVVTIRAPECRRLLSPNGTPPAPHPAPRSHRLRRRRTDYDYDIHFEFYYLRNHDDITGCEITFATTNTR